MKLEYTKIYIVYRKNVDYLIFFSYKELLKVLPPLENFPEIKRGLGELENDEYYVIKYETRNFKRRKRDSVVLDNIEDVITVSILPYHIIVDVVLPSSADSCMRWKDYFTSEELKKVIRAIYFSHPVNTNTLPVLSIRLNNLNDELEKIFKEINY